MIQAFLSAARSASRLPPPSSLGVALGILSTPFALALALIVARGVLTLYYTGGAASFDRRYEARIAQQVEAAPSQREGFKLLVDNWRPEAAWRRDLLASEDAPQDLCIAAESQLPDGRGYLMVSCGSTDSFRPVMFSTLGQRYLDVEMRERARWAIARMLRMSGERYLEIGAIAFYQTQPFTEGDAVVFHAMLKLPFKVPPTADILSNLDDRMTVVTNTAERRRSPIYSR
jgi:hypothetical protein